MGPASKKQKISKEGASKASTAKATPKASRKAAVEIEENQSSSDDEYHSADDKTLELESLEDSDDDLDDNDDVDVAGISSDDESADEGSEEESASENDSESDSEDGDEEKIPKLKKKKNLDDGSESFATAFNAIIGSRLKAYDRNDPILARNKTTLKKLESDKLEAKAKKLISAEKKSLHDKHRIKVLLPSADEPERVRELIDHEKKMKKTAQKGVVKLFNAVLSTQIRTNQDIAGESVGSRKKEELMNEISKEKFLDLVQAAGQA